MANKLGALFGKSGSIYDTATTTNRAGAPAFVRSDEEAVIRILTTGTFESTFYATARELAEEAIALFQKMRDTNPHFLMQAILYARNQGLMRTAPITALAVLSTGDEQAKELFRRNFSRVILTPGDLQDFIQLCSHSKIRGFGPIVQKSVRSWLSGISEYHVIKYGSDKQSMSLRDIYRIAHPKGTGRAQQIAQYVVKGTISVEDTLMIPQIAGYEMFKSAASAGSTGKALELIKKYHLPWEVVTAHLPSDTATWTEMAFQMPYMALLRNLRNLVKYGVFYGSKTTLSYVCEVIRDPDNVQKSKQFPFRFWSAYQALGNDVPFELKIAVEDALEASFINMPSLGDSVLIANDISGSMDSKPSTKSDMTMSEIAALYAAVCYRRAERGRIVSFNDAAIPRTDVNREMRTAQITRAVQQTRGGTNMSAPLTWAFGGEISGWGRRQGNVVEADPQTFDTAIFITDNQSWVDHLKTHSGVADRIKEYREKRNPNLKVFFIQLVPYKTSQVPQEMEGVYYISGWSSDVVNYIGSTVSGGLDQVETIRQVSVL